MNKRDNGFTLVELQIASFISFVVLAAIISLYIFSWRSFSTGDAILDVYGNSRNAAGWLTRDIRCAAQIVPNHGSYSTTDSSIVLMVPSIDSTGKVISSHYDYITYKLQGSDMYRIVEKDSSSSRQNENRVVARYCGSLVFSSGGVELSDIANLSTVNTVEIYLPINKSNISLGGSGTSVVSVTPTTIVRLRNK